jgi:hypothetical protein
VPPHQPAGSGGQSLSSGAILTERDAGAQAHSHEDDGLLMCTSMRASWSDPAAEL